jgi:hypothetical protein
MSDLSSKSVAVCDSGLFVHVAQCLAESFGRVYYHAPSRSVFDRISDAIIGDGLKNIERVQEPYGLIGKVDCWCFPDIGQGEFQKHLTRLGEHVWGHHGADILETEKGIFLETLGELGMNVPEHRVIHGMKALREHLRDRENVYIKVSRFRADWETAHWRNYTLDAAMLDCAAYKLGPVQEQVVFYVFEPIDAEIEDGIDTWRINGQWPKHILHAIERKDKSLLGGMQAFADVPEMVRGVNEAFGPALDEYGHQGAFSTEVRVTDQGEAIFNDPTIRFGSPPSQLQTAIITNLAEVIYWGAHGELVEPEWNDPVGGQALITSDREKDEWLSFQMPDELRPFVKSAFCCEVDGIFTIAPNPLENWAGWLVATGPDIAGVIETLKERKELLPDGFDCDLTSMCELLKELDAAQEQGITIAPEIPTPECVIESSATPA